MAEDEVSFWSKVVGTAAGAFAAVVTVVTVIALYGIFSIAAAAAGLLGIAGFLAGRPRYAGNVCRAMDALLAALLGWDGRATVSTECAKSSCRFCRALCRALNVVLERDHCEKQLER